MHLLEVNQLALAKRQEIRSRGAVAETLPGGNLVWTSLDAFSGAIGRLHDQRERGRSEILRVTETWWLEMATGIRHVLHLGPQASTEGP